MTSRAAKLPVRSTLLVVPVVGLCLLSGCATGTDAAGAGETEASADTPTADAAVAAETPSGMDRDAPPVCWNGSAGEGEPVTLEGPDGEPYELGGYEGWWNGTPADDEGGVLPLDEWPAKVLEHPATATVYVDDAKTRVLETYDRETCGPVADYVPPTPEDLEVDTGAGGFALLLDARTGEVLEHLASGL
ncbi:hypothetical protein IF650_01510 [Cellulosimicrobium terreum]|nr:hypothetical protein [Cellulosimicrobium terreum]